jgi:hypothetical protein
VLCYRDANSFKCAGMDEADDLWHIRQVVDGDDQECGTAVGTINQGRLYSIEVEVGSGGIPLRADGAVKASATCSSGVLGGKVGLRAADARFQNYVAERLQDWPGVGP